MRKHLLMRMPVLFFAIVLLLAACSKAEATTMNLAKSEGSVSVEDGDGKDIEPADNLSLYSGYDMRTQAASYAWISLDHAKLVKMDEKSRSKIQKDGKKLEILMNSGNLFFHVSEPLEEDESMGIRTSTMAVGIRGTCGWVSIENKKHSQVHILEGEVAVTASASEETVYVSAGQTADVTVSENGEAEITVSDFSTGAIPEFVLTELTQDEALADEILNASGLDVLNPSGDSDLAYAAYEEIIAEYRALWAEFGTLGTNFESDSVNWTNNIYPMLIEKYPNVSQGYLSSLGEHEPPYYSYRDLDGNGTEELIISYFNEYEVGVLSPVSVYTFNGTDAVPRDVLLFHELLADGLLLETGNGAGIGRGYRIGSDGYTWEEVTVSDLEQGASIYDADLSAHGGLIQDTLTGEPIE